MNIVRKLKNLLPSKHDDEKESLTDNHPPKPVTWPQSSRTEFLDFLHNKHTYDHLHYNARRKPVPLIGTSPKEEYYLEPRTQSEFPTESIIENQEPNQQNRPWHSIAHLSKNKISEMTVKPNRLSISYNHLHNSIEKKAEASKEIHFVSDNLSRNATATSHDKSHSEPEISRKTPIQQLKSFISNTHSSKSKPTEIFGDIASKNIPNITEEISNKEEYYLEPIEKNKPSANFNIHSMESNTQNANLDNVVNKTSILNQVHSDTHSSKTLNHKSTTAKFSIPNVFHAKTRRYKSSETVPRKTDYRITKGQSVAGTDGREFHNKPTPKDNEIQIEVDSNPSLSYYDPESDMFIPKVIEIQLESFSATDLSSAISLPNESIQKKLSGKLTPMSQKSDESEVELLEKDLINE